MVVKKYLCAAPRPESWEEKAETILKSLGGDKVKCKNVARQTLSILRERHKHMKKRTGPGRKSNAEHAIEFYEYLAGDKGIGQSDDNVDDSAESSDDDESSSSSSDQSSASSTVDTEEFLNQHDDACHVCNLGGELICCSTCSLVFHKECIRPVLKSIPSDWICPYCITQGVNNFKRHSKTWKSAASGIRQMERLKMELESVSQESKESDSAENEMSKEEIDKTTAEESEADNTTKSENEKSSIDNETSSLKKEGKRESKKEEGQQTQEDEEKKNRKDSKGGNTSAASSVSSAGAVSDSKRNLALYKIADSYSNSTENLVVRGRRQRKQPSLYQPQLCADSRWKSDEKNLGTGSSNDEDSDANSSDSETGKETDSIQEDKRESSENHRKPRRVLKKKRKKRTRDSKNKMEENLVICIGEDASDRKRSGSPFCNFCYDDASILICVFCGCRECFSKDESSLNCPACTKTKSATTPKLSSTRRGSAAMAEANATEGGSESDSSRRSSPNKKRRSRKITDVEVLEKRTRGRPSKLRVEKESSSSSLSPRKRVRTPKAISNSMETTEHRKRGRQSKSTTNPPATTPSIGRKRGRPPKNTPTTTPTSPSKSPPSPTPRKRGRPPKPSPDTLAVPSKVDSASRKKVSKATTPSSATPHKSSNSRVSEVPAKPVEPIKVSRVSGRTVKRASFYDEVEEGEQHLRSSKSPQSGDSLFTNHTSKPAPVKSQEAQTHRSNSKTPEKSEPSRKKQKQEEKAVAQTKDTPSETKPSKSQIQKTAIAEEKDEDMNEPPPIAPVRMKPVLQPPAPPIGPVRMKPVLQPLTPSIRPPISVSEIPNSLEKTESNVEELKKQIIDTGSNREGESEAKSIQANTAPTTTKPDASKEIEPPPSTSAPPKIDKPGATIVSKASVPKSATPRASPTFVQEITGGGLSAGTSLISSFPSTPLLDPVALEAAIKALPEPKKKEGEKTGITKTPRRKPGARECMQISRRFGVNIIPEKYMITLLDYCRRGKVEHLIKMRERLDCHSRFLEYQLAGLEARVKEVGESKIVVPAIPPHKRDSSSRHRGGGGSVSPTPLSLNKKATLGGSSNKAAVTTQAFGKKPPLDSQAPGGVSSKTKIENTSKKLSTKPTTAPKIPTSSSIPTATTKPSLPLAPASPKLIEVTVDGLTLELPPGLPHPGRF